MTDSNDDRRPPTGVAARAAAAAAAVAAEHGVRASTPEAIDEGHAVRVRVRPAPLVARVVTLGARLRQPPEAWLARELAVATYLAARGAPVVPPSDLVPPGPHERDGLWLTFWRDEGPPDGGGAPGGPRAAHALADLHAALRGYPGDAPLLAPALNDVPRALARLGRDGAVPAADVALVRGAYEALVLGLVPRSLGPLQPLHGDAGAGALVAAGGGWRWRDFEGTCLGPVAWDVAGLEEVGGSVASYPDDVDGELLATMRRARVLYTAVRWLAIAPEWPGARARAAPLLERLRRGV